MASWFALKRPVDVRNDVHDLAIIFEEKAVGHAHRADFGDAAYIVAAKIEKHEMLRAFLRVSQELRRKALVVLGRSTPGPCSSDGPDRDLAAPDANQDFRARACDCEAAEVQEIEEGRGIDAAKRPVKREGRKLEPRGEALREHDLEDIAGCNILFAFATIAM